MSPVVIDTNVLLIANGSHQDVSPSCRAECITRLLAHQKSGVVVIDDAFRILKEYQHKTKPNQPKGVGDVFLKWLLQNAANGKRVHRVAIIETASDEFAEFPDPATPIRCARSQVCCGSQCASGQTAHLARGRLQMAELVAATGRSGCQGRVSLSSRCLSVLRREVSSASGA